MTNKTENHRENRKNLAIKQSREMIWNASLMIGTMRQGLPLMQEYEVEAHLEILASYLSDAWERLYLEDTTE